MPFETKMDLGLPTLMISESCSWRILKAYSTKRRPISPPTLNTWFFPASLKLKTLNLAASHPLKRSKPHYSVCMILKHPDLMDFRSSFTNSSGQSAFVMSCTKLFPSRWWQNSDHILTKSILRPSQLSFLISGSLKTRSSFKRSSTASRLAKPILNSWQSSWISKKHMIESARVSSTLYSFTWDLMKVLPTRSILAFPQFPLKS